ncbi:MAG: hypothetical protein M1821_006614 [Bathelium mastoideum]|nr:MAG: hypothetical protein M1821_006614 [Bathelium mastoideum]KAI9692865.1 MAG: hypothetical protein M1822_004859 [Bathelium mastoideum]
MRSLHSAILLLSSSAQIFAAQSASEDLYLGYTRSVEGDQNSVVYDTAGTPYNGSTSVPDPDVFLNASVHVTEIDLTVTNLTAKINLAAQVLSLLNFNAGVDVSIDEVELLIENVNAHVLLEARLGNLVNMIGDVMNSLDLNPLLASVGSAVGNLTNATGSALGGALGGLTGSGSSTNGSSVTARGLDYNIVHNILYSVNNYQGDTHTNRVLAQDGDLVDESLDNNGRTTGRKVVGNYATAMKANGYSKSVDTTINGQTATKESEYNYDPFPGLTVVSMIYQNAAGAVVGTRVLSEGAAGGSSTIGED